MHHTFKYITLAFAASIIISCTPKSPEGLVAREEIYPTLQKGTTIESIVSRYGKPLSEDRKGDLTRVDYAYWPIPETVVIEGDKSPRTLYLIFVDSKLSDWGEGYTIVETVSKAQDAEQGAAANP